MIITLTDLDGVKFDVDTILIDEVRGGKVAELWLSAGEILHCRENALTVMRLIIDSKFKGENK